MLVQLVGFVMTYSFLSQHCKAPHPNLNHMDWDHVILGKKPIKQDIRGWAGLTCFNKLKENISKGIFQKNMLAYQKALELMFQHMDYAAQILWIPHRYD